VTIHGTLVVVLLSLVLSGCGSSRPLVVTPSPSAAQMGSVQCPDTSAKFYLGEVVDKRGNADPRNVGFTQTGLFNELTTLLAKPEPGEILGSALSDFLERCRLKSDDRAGADLTINTSLITLQVTEITASFSETISVELRCEFTVRAAATDQLARRFIVEVAAEESGLDTTQFASVLRHRGDLRQGVGGARRRLRGVGCGRAVANDCRPRRLRVPDSGTDTSEGGRWTARHPGSAAPGEPVSSRRSVTKLA